MDGSIGLSADDRKVVLQLYRNESGGVSRRPQVLLLAADGWSLRDIRGATFTSFDFIAQTLRRFRNQGLGGVLAADPPRPLPRWAKPLAKWVTNRTPADFGYFRRRWSCETLAEVPACCRQLDSGS
jgi:hypothetical protein